ncbi:hypothetical protein [Burkholderia multivorans]|uniref:hypothetical protein n=1 Tax=Burkholderia multivorans TaxID=87883 RepID=UPI001C21CE1D|nr:hypothetical protein [Burkholderia multivorans]MBU9284070.1 hypothetical protein [Burkholderia multivorans]
MTTTNHSRADALTDERIEAVANLYRLDLENGIDWCFDDSGLKALVRSLISESVGQHEAAPAGARFIAEHGHRLAQLLRIDAFDIADRDAQIMSALRGDTAPAQAAEPVAIPACYTQAPLALLPRVADLLHLLSFATIHTPSDGDEPQIRRALHDIKAMIAAAPQPAQADTIQCQAHSGPGCTECGGTGIWPAQADARAETLPYQRTFNAIAAATTVEGGNVAISVKAFRDAFGDAPAVARELPMMRKAFRVTEVSGDPDPAKQRFYMRFSFPSIEALHAADDEWRKFVAAPVSAPADAGEARLTDEQLARAAEQFNELLDAVELGSNSERKKARSAIHAFYRRALLNGADHDR